jgi:hypothetical protein
MIVVNASLFIKSKGINAAFVHLRLLDERHKGGDSLKIKRLSKIFWRWQSRLLKSAPTLLMTPRHTVFLSFQYSDLVPRLRTGIISYL